MHDEPLWKGSDLAGPQPREPGDPGTPTESRAHEIFDIDVERARRPVVAHVFGAVDLLTAPALRMCLEDHVDADGGLVLDLTSVDFLAAAALTVLADTDRRAARDHLAWAVVASTRPVLRPLEVVGLRDALPTYDTVPDAVAAVRAAALTG
ncbi:STAS domain-containing protein [Actinophytocola sp.]|uniref:STAS domain-containing protein n=1 Tax=Actinophytocola sp. TaxID=1872138 RepID=UPI003D6C2E18